MLYITCIIFVVIYYMSCIVLLYMYYMYYVFVVLCLTCIIHVLVVIESEITNQLLCEAFNLDLSISCAIDNVLVWNVQLECGHSRSFEVLSHANVRTFVLANKNT